MARPAAKHPTELELEILKILWREGPQSGRDVRDQLAEFRDLAYTSVMTVMGIMEDKSYLRRKKVDGAFLYSARIKESATKRRMLRDVVDRVYEGSTVSVALNLLQAAEIDDHELRQLRKLIRDKSGE
ncbi:MAG: BlaI/MecI/CopY family transcriptional regulator [Pirellulaceae bacterium]|jgi:predicted transcriptional regulator|nr:BlaI/MecI/CopY family transcriptional regulator [Pirellulaceae bacterium]MDP7018440.1 BlaI/MecI/CopY family transcriptional regulator [Pirellulaceae bacterium]